MINLIGHSGCQILLINKNEKTFVRKISKDIDYNNRMKLQCEKQEKFSHEKIFAPKILSKGYHSGLFYFDMEFVNGVKFNDFIKVNTIEKTNFFFSIILDFIFENIIDQNINFEDEIKNKINSITATNLIDNNIINNLKISSNKSLPSGYCHGDLTFENIIIANGKIYLIDFLDSYIDTPIVDISKLLQELDLNWSNRNNQSNLTSIIKNHFLKSILLDRVNKEISDMSIVNLQRKLTLMRILPYTNNLKLKLELLNIINKQI